MRLLLIEDDKPSLNALYSTLTMLGFQCVAFSDPEEAVARFQSERNFDAVITDLRMPKLSGTAVMAKIREFDPSMPILVITAHRDHAKLDADRIFYKPVDIQAMVDHLNLLTSKPEGGTETRTTMDKR